MRWHTKAWMWSVGLGCLLAGSPSFAMSVKRQTRPRKQKIEKKENPSPTLAVHSSTFSFEAKTDLGKTLASTLETKFTELARNRDAIQALEHSHEKDKTSRQASHDKDVASKPGAAEYNLFMQEWRERTDRIDEKDVQIRSQLRFIESMKQDISSKFDPTEMTLENLKEAQDTIEILKQQKAVDERWLKDNRSTYDSWISWKMTFLDEAVHEHTVAERKEELEYELEKKRLVGHERQIVEQVIALVGEALASFGVEQAHKEARKLIRNGGLGGRLPKEASEIVGLAREFAQRTSFTRGR